MSPGWACSGRPQTQSTSGQQQRSGSGQTMVKQRGEVAVKYWSQNGHTVVEWSRT